jgi:hypothetical protein
MLVMTVDVAASTVCSLYWIEHQRFVDLIKVYFFCENANIATIKVAKLNIATRLSYIDNKHHPLSKGACLIHWTAN